MALVQQSAKLNVSAMSGVYYKTAPLFVDKSESILCVYG